MTVQELRAARDEGRAPLLLDVREPEELTIASISGVVHIPMREVPARIAELDSQRPIVVFCHHGMRSQQVVGFLRQQQFTQVENLEGGIDAWSVFIDPAVPRY